MLKRIIQTRLTTLKSSSDYDDAEDDGEVDGEVEVNVNQYLII